jgi:hypothetical protein
MNPYRRRPRDYSIRRRLTIWAVWLLLFAMAAFVLGKLQ